MTILKLNCGENSLELRFPAASDQIREAVSRLTKGMGESAPVHITEVRGAAGGMRHHVQNADLRNENDAQKINTLTAKIDSMPQEKHRLFAAALEFEHTTELDDTLRVADSLDQYELFPQISSDEDLGRFLVNTSPVTGKFSFSEEARPYLDYAKIGAEQRAALGGAYTQYGFVKRYMEAPKQAEAPKVMLLTLTTPEQNCPLALPASEEQLSAALRFLNIKDFSQAVISEIEYSMPYLDQLIPQNAVTVEDANELAFCLQQFKEDSEKMTYCAALEAEDPSIFSEAVNIAMDLDDYERITDSEGEYARWALRGLRSTEELLEAIDGYTDFDELGRDMMTEDGVRQTGYGLVRRLSKPFPAEGQEQSPQMGGLS